MSNLMEQYVHYHNSLQEINRRAKEEPAAFAEESESVYRAELMRIAEKAARETGDCRIVLLAGPSASGKTTTASLLLDCLRRSGVSSYVFSLDNFYLSEEESPRHADGTPDFESVYALDIEQIRSCLLSLIETRSCRMPSFDFANHRPFPEKEKVELPAHSLVIMEGLHALNPLLSEGMPKGSLLHAYLSVKQGVEADGELLLSPNDMRLVRRLVRDARFRSCSAERTLGMWPSVMQGEYRYIKPFRPDADITINTFLGYESCVLREEALALLATIGAGNPYFGEARRLSCALERVTPLPASFVPSDSILHEFLG